jgi:hypothetical protein
MRIRVGRRKGRHELRMPAKLALTTGLIGILGALALTNAVAALRAPSEGFGRSGPALVRVAATSPLRLANAAPGAMVVTDTTIRYGDTAPAEIRLFGDVDGTGLARFLHVTVTSGSGRGGSFAPRAVVFDGTLAQMPRTFATGSADSAVIRHDEVRTYRVAVTLLDENAAQGLTAGATFTWGIAPV